MKSFFNLYLKPSHKKLSGSSLIFDFVNPTLSPIRRPKHTMQWTLLLLFSFLISPYKMCCQKISFSFSLLVLCRMWSLLKSERKLIFVIFNLALKKMNVNEQHAIVKRSLSQFMKKNIPGTNLKKVDQIVLEYVVSILEEASQDESFDVEGKNLF